MESTLSEREMADIETIVQKELTAKIRTRGMGEGYAFGGEVLGSLVRQVVIPMLISLSSRGLYDVLKGRILGHLGKKDADALKTELRNQKIPPGGGPLTSDGLEALKTQLEPLGFSEAEITALYELAKSRLSMALPTDPDAKAASNETVK